MKNLLFILIIGIALVTVIVFLIKNIITILAVVSFVACIIGFFSLDSLDKLEKQHNIKLVTKKQYKVMLSSLVTPLFLAHSYYLDHRVHSFTGEYSTGLSESFLVFISFAPGVLVMLYIFSQAGLKWGRNEEMHKPGV
ncbi:hypothetical protein [Neobacillus sp. OS1-33]|uniref:hypothetical protein n=1 Tax=Neobacillus sp. OS1-33 TaxID=3070683 RepID=UPI0027DFAE97|nr:hypothetical protein [Neobacillus sp. OS1-33]WML24119.1 hypothetical protein RCG22_14250 [Neobacillus sp. OS1-33]